MKSEQTSTLRFFSRSVVFIVSIIFGFLSVQSGQPQNVDPPRPVLDFRCPTYALPGNTPIVLRAEIIGAKELYQLPGKPVTYKWELSNGKLLDGQGTGRATIDTSGITNNTISKIDVKLEVEGAAPEVEREKTCQLTIDHQCNASALFDEYGAGSSEEQKAHLDRFVAYLRQAGPEATAYIITYAGRSACYYEAEWRIKQIVAYLIKKHGLSQNRIALVDGGFRETWSVDLFVQAHGKCGPLPTPTLLRNDARVSGQCGDKCTDGL